MGENKFLTSDKPTYLDFYFFESFQVVAFLTEGKIFEDYPALKRFHEIMTNLPGLKEYLETCDDKDKLFNAPFCPLNGKAGY